MMKPPSHSAVVAANDDSHANETLITRALVHFSELQEAGTLGSREQFLQLYPAIRTELEECLHNMDQLGQFTSAISHGEALVGAPVPAQSRLGDYEIIRMVGMGGMGIVYEARQISLGRRLALKVLHASSALDPRALARFKNEIQAAALLEHPHIVNVLNVGHASGLHFYTMRFIDGQSLAELRETIEELVEVGQLAGSLSPSSLASLTRQPGGAIDVAHNTNPLQSSRPCSSRAKRNLSEDYYRAIAQLGVQAAEGLFYAHQQGIVHRDIKPSNLMIDEHGHLWITDFGLARIENSNTLTSTGDLLGTLRFMSPEQMSSDRKLVDHRSDLYSLGATLYELSTLKPLVNVQRREEVLREVLHAAPIAPSTLQINYPRDLETIILKAVAKDPNDRYASCQALAEDLKCFLQYRAIAARRPSIPLRLRRWTQRNPQLARLTAVFMVIAVVGAIFSSWWISAARCQSQLERTQREIQQSLAQAAQANLQQHADVSESINAYQAWQHRDFGLLTRIVESWQDDRATLGFERQLLRQIADNLPRTLAHQTGEAYGVRVSHDESLVAFAGSSGVIILDRATGTELVHLREHRSDVDGIAWSGDDMQLATVGDDGQLLVYRREAFGSHPSRWKIEHRFQVDGALVQVEFVPNSNLVAACERTTEKNGPLPKNALHVWDLGQTESHQILEGPQHETEGLAVSADGQFAAVACRDANVYIWYLREKRLQRTIRVRYFDNDDGLLNSVAFAHHSNQLIVGTRNGTVLLCDTHSGEPLQTIASAAGAIETVAISPDDTRISLGTRDGLTRVFEKNSKGAWIAACDVIHSQGLWSHAFSGDGLLYACGRQGKLELVDSNLPMDRRRLAISSPRLASGSAQSQDLPLGYQASNWRRARLWERQALLDVLPLSISPSSDWEISNFAFSPDGRSVAVINRRRDLMLCDLRTGRPLSISRLNSDLGDNIAYSSDGQLLAVMSVDGRLSLFEAPSLRALAVADLGRQKVWRSIAFTDHDRILLVTTAPYTLPKDGSHTTLALNVPSLESKPSSIPRLLNANLAHANYTPGALAFMVELLNNRTSLTGLESLFNGEALAVSVAQQPGLIASLFKDNTIRIFSSGGLEQPLIIHTGIFNCTHIAISPDGSIVAVAAQGIPSSGCVRLFHTATGRELFGLPHYLSNLSSLGFTLDGNCLVAGGRGIQEQGELVIWGQSPEL